MRRRLGAVSLLLIPTGIILAVLNLSDGQARTHGDRDLIATRQSTWHSWRRPVDQPVFSTEHGNNHDAIFFYDPELEYPYYLIIGHGRSATHLWRAKNFSWSSSDWELVSDDYQIGGHYEYDDGVKVGDTYYLFEGGQVYTFAGALEDASGRWISEGTFPVARADDVGVWYEDGMFHIFGEYGHFPGRPDGTSLSHFQSPTGLGDWQLVDKKAVDPNPNGGRTYGIGDPTIIKVGGEYYLFSDLETRRSPYRIAAWRSSALNEPFEYLGIAIAPRAGRVDDWDNTRVQDGEVAYIPEIGRYVMFANMLDDDGVPARVFPTLKPGRSRVIGVFLSDGVCCDVDAHGATE